MLMRIRNSLGQRIRRPSGARMNDSTCCCDGCCTTVVITIDGVTNRACDNCDAMNTSFVFTEPFPESLTSPQCSWSSQNLNAATLCGAPGTNGYTTVGIGVSLDLVTFVLTVTIRVATSYTGVPTFFTWLSTWKTTLSGYPACDGTVYPLTFDSESTDSSLGCDLTDTSLTVEASFA